MSTNARVGCRDWQKGWNTEHTIWAAEQLFLDSLGGGRVIEVRHKWIIAGDPQNKCKRSRKYIYITREKHATRPSRAKPMAQQIPQGKKCQKPLER